jgi:hypothetical protein
MKMVKTCLQDGRHLESQNNSLTIDLSEEEEEEDLDDR